MVDKKLRDKLLKLRPLIGNTPLLPLNMENISLYAKLEYFNFSGSIKDRIAYNILIDAFLKEAINVKTTIIESSSGNFAISMAMICKYIGLNFTPVIDKAITNINLQRLQILCDKVVQVENSDRHGNQLQARIDMVKKLCQNSSNFFWTNQYANESNFLAHYNETGPEIGRSFEKIDYIFIGAGTCGTLAGVSLRLKEMFPAIKIIAVDSEGSVALGGKAKKRYLPGIGSSQSNLPFQKKAYYDEVMFIPEIVTIKACHELAQRHGLFVGASSGTVYAAIKQYFSKKKTRRKPTVVFLCPDGGSSYLDSVYNAEWIYTQYKTFLNPPSHVVRK